MWCIAHGSKPCVSPVHAAANFSLFDSWGAAVRRYVILGAPFVAALLAAGGGLATADDGVSAVDSRDVFVVRAGGMAGSNHGESGRCDGCVTVVRVPVCAYGVDFESPPPGSGCLTVGSRDCDPGEQFVREWTAGPAGWIQGGLSCLAPGDVITVEQLAAQIRDKVAHRVPAPQVISQPDAGPLMAVPVLLDSRQPDGPLEWHDSVAGVPVTTQVSAEWRWQFGDGSVLTTDRSGSRWPDTSVSHVYRGPGWVRVTLTTTWSGTFEIPGLGWQPIDGNVTQTATRNLEIRAAGAVLQPETR